jgi:hypothetical protein
MRQLTFLFLRFMASFFKSKAILQAENLALRHQLCVLGRSVKRPRIRPCPYRKLVLLAMQRFANTLCAGEFAV